METNVNENEIIEIDLLELIGVLWRHAVLIVLAVVVAAGAVFCYKSASVPEPVYTSTTKIIVQAREEEGALSSVDLTMSTSLAQDYIQLIRSNDVMATVIDELGLVDKSGEPMTVSALLGKVNVTLISNTRVISIAVTDSSPELAQQIADTVRQVALEYIKTVSDTEAFSVASFADLPDKPTSADGSSSPVRSAAIGGVLAAVAVCAVIVTLYLLDNTIKTAEDVERYMAVSVLGVVTGKRKGSRRNGK